MNNQNSPAHLIKYDSAKAAKHILSTVSLRWCSPQHFVDPFQLKQDEKLNFSKEELLNQVIKTISSMIFARDKPAPGVHNHPINNLICRWRREERFNSEEEVDEALGQILNDVIERQMNGLQTTLKSWKERISLTRMLCFFESIDEPDLWKTHADNHRGVALKFETGEAAGFENLQSVEYTRARPQIVNLNQEVDVAIGQVSPADDRLLSEVLLQASKTKAIEKEWRCVKMLSAEAFKAEQQNHPAQSRRWAQYIGFPDSALKAVYFGALLREKDKQELIYLIKNNFPGTPLFQMLPDKSDYVLLQQAIEISADTPQQNDDVNSSYDI